MVYTFYCCPFVVTVVHTDVTVVNTVVIVVHADVIVVYTVVTVVVVTAVKYKQNCKIYNQTRIGKVKLFKEKRKNVSHSK